jgi:hypothetical protein
MLIFSTSRCNDYLDCTWLVVSWEFLPQTPLCENLSLNISLNIHNHAIDANFKHMISSRCSSWTCALNWSTLNHFFFLHRDVALKLTVNSHTISSSSRYVSIRIKSLIDILWITHAWTSWSAHEFLHFLLLSTLEPTYDSIVCIWIKPLAITQWIHYPLQIVISYQNTTWGLHALSITPRAYPGSAFLCGIYQTFPKRWSSYQKPVSGCLCAIRILGLLQRVTSFCTPKMFVLLC